MGYTTKSADEFIGLGLTSIGFIKDLFIQNQKHINNYYRDLDGRETSCRERFNVIRR